MIASKTGPGIDLLFDWHKDVSKREPETDRISIPTIPWTVYDQDEPRIYRFLVIAERDDDSFSAYTPSLPGAAGQGPTAEEAIADLELAVRALLAEYRIQGQKPPIAVDPDEPASSNVLSYWIDISA